MTVPKRLRLLVAVCWLGLGCLALAGLAQVLDNQVVGWTLIVPAIPLGLVAPAGWFRTVSDGWPVLTVAGVGAVYVVPGVLLLTCTGFGCRARATRESEEPAVTRKALRPFRWGRVLALAAVFSTIGCLRHWMGIREPGFLPVPIGEAFEEWPALFAVMLLAVALVEQYLGRSGRDQGFW